MKIKLLTLAVILLVSLQVSINAQTGQLSGSVLQSAGKPLSGVHVTLRELSAGTSTDADGNFSFRGIPAGTYTVVTSHIGYKPVMMEVVIRSGETRKINFNLE
ncbi:partial TonB-dependent receptor P39, partial [Anaerolineae bacterium]